MILPNREKFPEWARPSNTNSLSIRLLFTKSLLALVRVYQLLVSPLFPPQCRFQPSCSNYALHAINKFLPGKALLLILKRVFRCHPWGGSGYDPIPD